MKTLTTLTVAVLVASLAACQRVDDSATAVFRGCLERHGVVAEDVAVAMRGGSIEGISLRILGEGDLPYEPNVRLACSEEVEQR